MIKNHDAVCPEQMMGLLFAGSYELAYDCRRVCDYRSSIKQSGRMKGINCISPNTCDAWKGGDYGFEAHGMLGGEHYCQRSDQIEGDGAEAFLISVPICDEQKIKEMPPIVYPNLSDPWGLIADKRRKEKEEVQAAKEEERRRILTENMNKFHVLIDPTSLIASVIVEPDFYQHDFVILLFDSNRKKQFTSLQNRAVEQMQSADVPMSGRSSGIYTIELKSKNGDRLGSVHISLDAATSVVPESSDTVTGVAR